MILAIDAMGGDNAPIQPVIAAVNWAAASDDRILLVGQREVLAEELKKAGYTGDQIEIIHASQVVEMEESPAMVMRRKKDSSIVVATQLVKDGKADAVLSCGSTGAQMVSSMFILGRMEGVDRSPVIALLPQRKGGQCVLLDVGANVDCKPEQLLQFALLGQIFADSLLNRSHPVVMLLNNGGEEGKGNAQAQATYAMLKADRRVNFAGNIEGRDIFNGDADIIVCDGFVGNVMLKTIEGVAGFMMRLCMEEQGTLPRTFAQLDYAQVGGSPLLGINGISMVCHGSSNHETIFNGIRMAKQCCNLDLVGRQRTILAANMDEKKD